MLRMMLLLLASSAAQAQGSYPGIDKIAGNLVQKYNTSSCQQLAAEQKAPKDPKKAGMADKIGAKLQQDPAMRAAFVKQVAAPIVDKMIACGFIP